MVNTVLTALLLVACLFSTVFVVILCKELLKIDHEIRNFVKPKGENQTSPAADVFDIACKHFLKCALSQFKTSNMGDASVISRQEMAVDSAIAEDLLAINNPMVAGLLDLMPTLKKKINKNPKLVGIALEKLSQMKPPGGSGTVAPGDNHSESPIFQFKA